MQLRAGKVNCSAESTYVAICDVLDTDRNYGRGYIWTGWTATKEECCNECANRQMCLAWDWNGRICWVKDNNDVNATADSSHWSGRMLPPWPVDNSTLPGPARVEYDDSQWQLVDTPHDMGREREFSCLQSGRRGLRHTEEASPEFLHNCSGWYRKHFSLPAEWKHGVTWVYFEGIMHDSVVFLNSQRC